ncbi:forkhead box protein P3 [Salmo trutta]|nr:forkhead box protein P3-like [Salmo trutta]XP_029579199.1 forkhead box protein P3-like [Salmo trutta]XP_029579200.1 forkhead box protein P3-like [Salmo trutta]XP_029579201.1 forkhead box protein P3-like [Salmo trutta]
MPQTESERLKSGRLNSGRQQQQRDRRGEHGEEPDTRTKPNDSVSPRLYARTSVTQMGFPLMIRPGRPLMASSQLQSILLQQCSSEEEGKPFLQRVSRCTQLSQHRPSVLRQGVLAAHVRPQAAAGSAQPISLCKVEVDTGSRGQSSPPHSEHSPGPTRHPSPLRRASPKQSSIITRHHEPGHPTLRSSSALFLNGLCCWPGCDAVFEEFPRFLKHLHSDHGHGDRSIAQWRVQQDMVQYMETQLTVEKQKLFAMQLHLHLSEHKSTGMKAGSDWPYSHSLALVLPQNPSPARAADGVPRCATKEPEELAQQEYWPAAAPHHLLPDLVPSVECYKYNNIRPPYTYACLIRWSIMETPDKQRSLNDIYNWFTTMFFYFRHNTATWKNAVRHNLSLHKCFVRVEGGKGAVWTVDEMEYQRRKGQKYHRDHHVKWLAPFSLFRPEEP